MHKNWLGQAVSHVDNHPTKKLIPVLEEFREFIENNPRIYMYFTEMWDEIPHKPPYNKDPTGKSQIRNYKHMLEVLNHVFVRHIMPQQNSTSSLRPPAKEFPK